MRQPVFSSEQNGLVGEVTNPWSCSALTSDNGTVYAPTPRKKVEVLTQERIQSKDGHKTFDIPSYSVFYDINWMPSDINYNTMFPQK